MRDSDRKIIDAIIRKAEKVCPDSLALIGLCGSVSTGDVHARSDLDLMILINDDKGRQLAQAFILDDTDIGYDIYCTTWQMLEEQAECGQAHLAKLFDSKIVYIKDESALAKIEALKERARGILTSEARFAKARGIFDTAKSMYAGCMLAERLASVRTYASAALYYLMDALMIHHGSYFKRGVKYTFEEMRTVGLQFDAEAKIMAVICAETSEGVQAALTDLMRCAQADMAVETAKPVPTADNLRGTYEEMYSNWRGKMYESAARGDVFSSFMAMSSLKFMLSDIGDEYDIKAPDVMAGFTPSDLQHNVEAFEKALAEYLEEYKKAGIKPLRYSDADDFAERY